MKETTPALTARGLSRRFGYRTVFREVDLAAGPGDVVVLLGPNGSGKTTLLRVLAGLLAPSDGSLTVTAPVELVGHQTMVYDALTARENLRFFARLLGNGRRLDLDDRLEQVGLTRWADERVASFSHGLRQRLAIARALLCDPRVLLLDEPYNGLDQDGLRAVNDVFDALRDGGCALVVVTHDFGRVRSLATHVGYLVGGRLHGLDAPDDERVAARYRELTAGV